MYQRTVGRLQVKVCRAGSELREVGLRHAVFGLIDFDGPGSQRLLLKAGGNAELGQSLDKLLKLVLVLMEVVCEFYNLLFYLELWPSELRLVHELHI
jgi:hypothetical protein